MEKWALKTILGLMAGLLLACATQPQPPTMANPYRPLGGFQNITVVGNVRASFLAGVDVPPGGTASRQVISQVNGYAYAALHEVATRQHGEHIYIADISWVRVRRVRGMFSYSATGKVVTRY